MLFWQYMDISVGNFETRRGIWIHSHRDPSLLDEIEEGLWRQLQQEGVWESYCNGAYQALLGASNDRFDVDCQGERHVPNLEGNKGYWGCKDCQQSA